MSHWNYRMIQYADAEKGIGMHEVYYDSRGVVMGYTETAVDITGESAEELEAMLFQMLFDCDEGILIEENLQ